MKGFEYISFAGEKSIGNKDDAALLVSSTVRRVELAVWHAFSDNIDDRLEHAVELSLKVGVRQGDVSRSKCLDSRRLLDPDGVNELRHMRRLAAAYRPRCPCAQLKDCALTILLNWYPAGIE